jgi:hypothetical protein
MLFLGAGASEPFGVPPMRPLTKLILREISESKRNAINEIVKRLELFGFVDPDIEGIMDVLAARRDPLALRATIGPKIIELREEPFKPPEQKIFPSKKIQFPSNVIWMGPTRIGSRPKSSLTSTFLLGLLRESSSTRRVRGSVPTLSSGKSVRHRSAQSLSVDDTNVKPRVDSGLLLDEIKDIIDRECRKADFDKASRYYEKFFLACPGEWVANRIPAPYKHIFTTNYDRCVDKFMNRQPQGCQDGFVTAQGVGQRVFVGNWDDSAAGYTLCKLHGSVNWFRLERVSQLRTFPGPRSPGGGFPYKRSMVYPATEKFAFSSPYVECLFYLRRRLAVEDQCVVAGYSFRDPEINTAFYDAFALNPRLKVFLVSPHASKNCRLFEEPLRSKVIPIDARFGTQEAIDSLREHWQARFPFLEDP